MIPDWITVFKRSEQINSVAEATELLNFIATLLGIHHFQIKESNVVLAGTVHRDAPAPLKADAAIVFDQFGHRNSPLVASRLKASNQSFWLDERQLKIELGASVLLCCPVRYGRSEETYALFLTHTNSVSDLEATLLQSCLVTILERLLKLDLLLNQKTQPLKEREQVCLSMYAQGQSIARISRELGMAEQVVVQTMTAACSRLLANNLSHAIAIAIRNGMI